MASPGSVVIQFAAKADQARRDVLKFAKDLGKVETEASTVDESLKDVQRAIDKTGDVAKAAAPGLQRVETSLDGVADEAEATARRLRTAATQMAAGVRQGASGIDTATDGIRGDLADTGKEAGAEFVSNIAEGIGSGQANLNDVVQGTLGGIVNLLGKGGPLLTAAALAAIGVGTVFQAVQGQAKKAYEEISTLREALKDVGSVSSEAARKIIFQTWVTEAEKVPGKIEAVNSAIKTAGISAEDFQRALAGDEGARKRVIGALTTQYSQILANKRETGKITKEQEDYLAATETILEDLGTQQEKVKAVKKQQEALSELTGTTAKKVKDWDGNLDDVATVMALIKQDAEKIEGTHSVNFIVSMKDKNGRPVRLGPGQLAAPPPGAPARAAAPATRAQAQTVQVNVRGVPALPDSPRALVAMLESHTVRMGRKPGAPRARAW